MLTVGIDIGTSFSSIAFLNEKTGEAELVKVQSGYGDKNSMPSAVFVEENGNVLLGQAALNAKMRDPASFKAEFKRDLGQEVPYMLGNSQLLPEELYKEVFIHFKKCAEESTGDKIGKAYITYPANYNKRKKELVEGSARKAGLLDVELIDEPSAAAFSYSSKEKIREGDILLIYDFGGGTFDTALMQYSNGVFKPLTEAIGLERCGGIDIDNLIFEDILSRIPEEQLQGIAANAAYQKRFNVQVMDASIRIKHQLSDSETVQDVIPVGFDTCDYALDRARFNGMIHELVEETMDRVRSIIAHAGIKTGDIAHVVVVGGTSRIPYVRERLQHMMDKEICKDIDADLAICRGAALMQQVKKESSPEEQFQTGRAHYDNEEYEKTFQCFTKAAEDGHAGAQYHLGKLYDDGDGVEQDDGQAAAWYRKSAEQGNADAQYRLGEAYSYGFVGMEEDDVQAKYWYEKSAEQGNAEAQNALGGVYFHGFGVQENFQMSAYWHLKAAGQGITESQYFAGLFYETGEGLEQDYKQAAYWYSAAAQKGDMEAACSLGKLYMQGNGMPKDMQKALEWIRLSAEKGSREGMLQLGLACMNGTGMAKDAAEAFRWFKKSAEKGKLEAQFNTALCYDNGTGVSRDAAQAAYWYQKAAEQGDAEAQFNLGLTYEQGEGVKQDLAQAAFWYQKAAEQGEPQSQYNLGCLYFHGTGVRQDHARSCQWFKKAADLGLAAAQYNLGYLYANGLGVTRDYHQAGILWEKAAAQGDEDAKQNLKMLRKDYSGRYVKA